MPGDEPEPAMKYEGAAAALEFAMWSLDEQLQTIKDIDARAERALTLAVAILALFSGASTFQWGGLGERWWLLAPAAVVIGVFLTAVLLFFRCQEAANLHLGPDSRRLLALSADRGEGPVRQWLAEHIYHSVGLNAELMLTKNKRYKHLAYAVMAEAISASVAVVIIASL